MARRTGLTPNAVNAWTTGRNLPGTGHILAICRETGVRLEWLAFGSGPMVRKHGVGDTVMPYEVSMPEDQRRLLAAYSKLKRAHQAALLEFINKLSA